MINVYLTLFKLKERYNYHKAFVLLLNKNTIIISQCFLLFLFKITKINVLTKQPVYKYLHYEVKFIISMNGWKMPIKKEGLALRISLKPV